MTASRVECGAMGLPRDRSTSEWPELGDVSVVIPVYNGADYLRETLDSVLVQSVSPRQIIVVDDGSTDPRVQQILHRYDSQITVLSQANQGQSVARNRGVEASTGQWIAILDADDVWHPDKLKQQLAVCHDADVVYTGVRLFGAVERVATTQHVGPETMPRPTSAQTFAGLLQDNFITHSSVLIRRSAWERVGGYDVRLQRAVDWDLWLRLAAAGCRFRCAPEALTLYRWRNDSLSKQHQAACRDRVRVLRRALAGPAAGRLSAQVRRTAFAEVWRVCGWFAEPDNPWLALQSYARSLCYRPWSRVVWRAIVRTLIRSVRK